MMDAPFFLRLRVVTLLRLSIPFCLMAAPLVLHSPARARDADGYELTAAQKSHWAWKPPIRPSLPAVKDAAWVQNPIDAFILARLEARGLRPAPKAEPETLLRRLTFDLIGLPPTPREIAAFKADCSAPGAGAAQAAIEKAVDRLLASPHYGERWGRHWLDLARFAESNGYELDETRPDAWRYRDYVVNAFNTDKPYDRFVQEQLAGDELFPGDVQALIATGFNLLGPDMTDAASQMQRRQNTLDDMTDTAGLAFLGMTIGCARCHDHKFEPIPQTDYFRLQAFFSGAMFRKDAPVASKEELAQYAAALKEYQAKTRPIDDLLAKIEEPYRTKLHREKFAELSEAAQAAHRTLVGQRTSAQADLVLETAPLLKVKEKEILDALSADDRSEHQKLKASLKALDSSRPASPSVAMALANQAGSAPKTRLLERGELASPGVELNPGFPIALAQDHRPVDAVQARGPAANRRATLAKWLTRPDHPLTARVFVNRLWQHHFGVGIVATANDFGIRGMPPTHPELLDWLAAEFVSPTSLPSQEKGRGPWSIKRMHRLIVLSAAYQQSSRPTAESLQKDPTNNLYSRMNRQRLEGEIIRDSLLAISGRLNPKMGGRGVFPPVPVEATKGSINPWVASKDPDDHRRRSVYIFARRNLRFPFLEAFDLPDSNQSCPRRDKSVSAPQALALLNAADVVAAAKATANRLAVEASTRAEQIELAYRLILGRPPHADEVALANDFLRQSPFSEFCRALFNVNEFVYVD
jgi:hypothetical protein